MAPSPSRWVSCEQGMTRKPTTPEAVSPTETRPRKTTAPDEDKTRPSSSRSAPSTPPQLRPLGDPSRNRAESPQKVSCFLLTGQPPLWFLSHLPTHQHQGGGAGGGRCPRGAVGRGAWGGVEGGLESDQLPRPARASCRSAGLPGRGRWRAPRDRSCRPAGSRREGPWRRGRLISWFTPEWWAEGRSGRPPEVFRPGPQTRQAATSRPKAALQLAR